MVPLAGLEPAHAGLSLSYRGIEITINCAVMLWTAISLLPFAFNAERLYGPFVNGFFQFRLRQLANLDSRHPVR